MKKIKSILITLILLLGCAAIFMSCTDDSGDEQAAPKDQDSKTIMNISMNPKVEFVLDKNNKVISVNALNEEGNLIITAGGFVGKNAPLAAEMFISVSQDMGFVVGANANVVNKELNISVSGSEEEASLVFNGVKNHLDAYLSETNISITVKETPIITKAELEALVAECEPYLKAAEIKAMEYYELIDVIYESRKETAEYYSQELKKAYYEAKANALAQAEFEVIKRQLGTAQQIAFELLNQSYANAVENIEKIRMAELVSADSTYQQLLAAFREKKTEYLRYREELAAMEPDAVNELKLGMLATLEAAVNAAEEAVLAAGRNANASLDAAKASATALRDQLVASIKTYSALAGEHLDTISAKQKEAETKMFAQFETDYQAAIVSAEAAWKNMHDSIKAPPSPEGTPET